MADYSPEGIAKFKREVAESKRRERERMARIEREEKKNRGKQVDYKGNPRSDAEQARLERKAKELSQKQKTDYSPEVQKYLANWTADRVEKAENDIWN